MHSTFTIRIINKMRKVSDTIKLFILVVMSFLIASTHVLAADVKLEVSDVHSMGARVASFYGPITPSDIAKVKALPESINILFLSSEGGDVSAAIEIGRHIRERQMTVWIPQNATCFSSCSFIYIGGVNRLNLGVLGLHRPYLGGSPNSASDIKKVIPTMLENIRIYVKEMGITERFTELMLNTPSESMYKFYGEEVESIIPKTDIIYNEIQTALNARQYGLTTDEYRKRDSIASESCRHVSRDIYLKCSEAIKWDITLAEFENRIEKTNECLLSKDEVKQLSEASESGIEWREHPLAIKNFNCEIKIMTGVK